MCAGSTQEEVEPDPDAMYGDLKKTHSMLIKPYLVLSNYAQYIILSAYMHTSLYGLIELHRHFRFS